MRPRFDRCGGCRSSSSRVERPSRSSLATITTSPLVERRHEFGELRPVSADAADLFFEDLGGSGVLEGFELEAQVLVLSAYSRISDDH